MDLDNENNLGRKVSSLATSFWRPHLKEKKALSQRNYLNQFGRVDQIWPWLEKHHGQVLAVDAPHVAHPEQYSFAQLSELIATTASSFFDLGVSQGDVVALFAENSPRWLIADQALMRIGASDAVRGASAPVEELRYILEDSGAVALVVQNADLWTQLDLSEAQIKSLKLVVQLEGTPLDGVLSWKELVQKGIGKKKVDSMKDRGVDTAASTTATILYTSGTTGRPKGVPLSHANLLHQMRSLACIAHPPVGAPVLSVLPIWHAYERSAEYYFFSCACTQTYTNIKQLKKDLPRVRPVVMVTVPRLWEAVKAGFDDALKGMPKWRQGLLKVALANSGAQRFAWRKCRNILLEPVSPIGRLSGFVLACIRWPFHGVSAVLLWPKVLMPLCGGRLRFPINGGGAIAPHVDAFFEALGVEMLVGYGLTETSPVVCCRRPWRNIRGSSGPPLPETQFRIVDVETGLLKNFYQQGRVLVKGPQVMSGYLGKPDASKKVLNDHGWFDTGDLGLLLEDGSLVLTGRAKDTIVLSSGENIEPGPLEETLVSSPLVEQVMLVGQDEKQLGALVVPKVEAIKSFAAEKGLRLPETFASPPGENALRKTLRTELNSLLAQRKGSRPDERVLGVALVEPFTIENGLLTQTLKQRRERISARDQDCIEEIYGR